jgi:hypothetical protein
MHTGVAATDALRAVAAGDVRVTVTSLFRRSVVHSLSALIEEMSQLRRLAPRRKRGPAPRLGIFSRFILPLPFAWPLMAGILGWIGLQL